MDLFKVFFGNVARGAVPLVSIEVDAILIVTPRLAFQYNRE